MKTLTYVTGSKGSDPLFHRDYENDKWTVSILYHKSDLEYEQDLGAGNFDLFLSSIHFRPKLSKYVSITFAPPLGFSEPQFIVTPKSFIASDSQRMKDTQAQLAGIEDVIEDAKELFDNYFPGVVKHAAEANDSQEKEPAE